MIIRECPDENDTEKETKTVRCLKKKKNFLIKGLNIFI